MEFDNIIYVRDIISIIALIPLVASGIFGVIQWKKSLEIKRAEYIGKLNQELNDVKDIMYILDYGKDWYNKDFHGGSKIEKKIDEFLSFFSYICYLYKCKLISKKEFPVFKYYIERIFNNNQIQYYFCNIYHFAKRCKVPISFKYLLEYGENNKKFNKDFYNSKSEKYPHYLSF